jgi:ABC-type amino acid transport substrate-binding protein
LALAALGAGASPPLRVCLLDADPPRSRRAPESGFDRALAGELARALERELAVVWISPPPPQMDELESSDLPLEPLRTGACDAVASVPGEAALAEQAEQLALSRPYYGATFELIGPDPLPDALAQLRGRRVAVQRLSVAHLALERAGARWLAYDRNAQLVAALEAGEVEAALVWGPALSEVGRPPRADFQTPPVLRWNFHWATRRADPQLGAELDAALGRLIDSGRVARALAEHGVPARAPFEQVHSPAALSALRQGAP